MTSEEAAQEAWSVYVNREYIDPDIIMAVRRAFLAAHQVGWSDGFSAGLLSKGQPDPSDPGAGLT